jgi:flagellar basal-body rod protein FlgC
MMINALQIAASGVRLGQAKLDQTAHNVANSQTEGYERHEVVGEEAPGGGVRPRTVPGVDDGLAADLVSALLAKHTVQANAAVFRRADGMTGDLLDILG